MRRGSSAPPASKSWNLMLDDPALSTRHTGTMAQTSGSASFARCASAISDPTAQEARRVIWESARLVRMMGTQHDPGGIRIGQKGQALGEHVASLEIRDDKDVGLPGNR